MRFNIYPNFASFCLCPKHLRSHHEVAELEVKTREMQQLKVLQMLCKVMSPCCPTPGNECLYLPGTSSSSSPVGEYNETNSTHHCHNTVLST